MGRGLGHLPGRALVRGRPLAFPAACLLLSLVLLAARVAWPPGETAEQVCGALPLLPRLHVDTSVARVAGLHEVGRADFFPPSSVVCHEGVNSRPCVIKNVCVKSSFEWLYFMDPESNGTAVPEDIFLQRWAPPVYREGEDWPMPNRGWMDFSKIKFSRRSTKGVTDVQQVHWLDDPVALVFEASGYHYHAVFDFFLPLLHLVAHTDLPTTAIRLAFVHTSLATQERRWARDVLPGLFPLTPLVLKGKQSFDEKTRLLPRLLHTPICFNTLLVDARPLFLPVGPHLEYREAARPPALPSLLDIQRHVAAVRGVWAPLQRGAPPPAPPVQPSDDPGRATRPPQQGVEHAWTPVLRTINTEGADALDPGVAASDLPMHHCMVEGMLRRVQRLVLGRNTYERREDDSTPLIVYANRAASKGRAIVNSEDVCSALHELKGVRVECILFEDISILESAHLLAQAAVFITPAGSSVANAAFMRAGSAVVVLWGHGLYPCLWPVHESPLHMLRLHVFSLDMPLDSMHTPAAPASEADAAPGANSPEVQLDQQGGGWATCTRASAQAAAQHLLQACQQDVARSEAAAAGKATHGDTHGWISQLAVLKQCSYSAPVADIVALARTALAAAAAAPPTSGQPAYTPPHRMERPMRVYPDALAMADKWQCVYNKYWT